MGENWIESSWSGLTLEEKLAWLTNNLYWLKINMDVNDNKFIKMYNELKSNFEDFSLYVNNSINDVNNNINDVNNIINDVNNNKQNKFKYIVMKTYLGSEHSEKININNAKNKFLINARYFNSDNHSISYISYDTKTIFINGKLANNMYVVKFNFKMGIDNEKPYDDYQIIGVCDIMDDGIKTQAFSFKLDKELNQWKYADNELAGSHIEYTCVEIDNTEEVI